MLLEINKEFQLNVEHRELTSEERMLGDGGEHKENTEMKELLWFRLRPISHLLEALNIEESDECRLGATRSLESPEHLLRECEATRTLKRELYRKKREIDPERELEDESS